MEYLLYNKYGIIIIQIERFYATIKQRHVAILASHYIIYNA